MVDAKTTQASFTAGELMNSLHGRKDLAKYQVGAKFVENFLVLAQGGLVNRPGLRLATEVKNSAQHVRLGRHAAAGDEAFLLEIGHQYIRPLFAGAYLPDGLGVVETATPYEQDDTNSLSIDDLHLAQSNDVATLTHHGTAPREYSRTGPSTFTLSTITFQPAIAAPPVPTATGTNAYTGYGSDVVPQKEKYKVSAINAAGEESLPSPEDESDIAVAMGYSANYITITWAAVAGATEYLIYKAKNGVFGLIGNTPNLTFKDDNIEPDFSNGPQTGANPFNAAGDYPSIASFAQQRRIFAATDNNPQTTWGTQSGNFKNLGVSSPAKDDDAIEFTLAAEQKQDIFYIFALKTGMIVFTRSGEWTVTGRDGDIITPSSILPEPQSYYGSSETVKPLVVGKELLFLTRTDRQVRNMKYAVTDEGYVSDDLTLLAGHLFETRQVIAWDYAAAPYGVIWCVMSDGEALSFTYLPQHEVWGWTRHHTAGKFLDVKVVPEFGRDVPYFLIQRRVGGVFKKYIEFLEARDFYEVEDCFFVDSGLTYDVPLAVTTLALGTSTVLTVPAHGLVDGAEVDVALLGLVGTDGKTSWPLDKRYTIDVLTTDTFRLLDEMSDPVDTSEYSDRYYDGGGVVRVPTEVVGGLGHLEGLEVVALGDGNVIEGLVVTGGQVELPHPYSRVHVGLPYTSTLITLDVQNVEGDDTGVTKAIPTNYLRVTKSRGFKLGGTPETAEEPPSREDEDYDDPASEKEGLVEIGTWGSWDTSTQVAVVQTYPLPLTILGITNDVVYGG